MVEKNVLITRVFRIAEADLAIQSRVWQLQLRAHPPNGSRGLPSKQKQFLVVGGGGVRKMGVVQEFDQECCTPESTIRIRVSVLFSFACLKSKFFLKFYRFLHFMNFKVVLM